MLSVKHGDFELMRVTSNDLFFASKFVKMLRSKITGQCIYFAKLNIFCLWKVLQKRLKLKNYFPSLGFHSK